MPRPSKAAIRPPPGPPSQTFVLDNGAYTLKAGFAPTEECSDAESIERCHLISNALARTREKRTYVATEIETEIAQWSDVVFRRPVEHGQIVSWEAQKEIWDQSFFDEKAAERDLYIRCPEDTTLILTEPPNTMPVLQKNADEIVMEEWGFGGYMRVIGSTLNAYNDLHPLFEGSEHPKSTISWPQLPMECLLVIDSGYSHTTVTPTFNGRPLQRAIRRLDFGGKHLTNLLKEVISMRYFDLHQDTKVVNDIKEDVCFVSESFNWDLEKTWKKFKKQTRFLSSKTSRDDSMDLDGSDKDQEIRVDYILPDGVHLLRGFSRLHDPSAGSNRKRNLQNPIPDSEISMTLGSERFSVPEIIFTPADIGSKQPGVAECVMQSLAVLPSLVQATMLSNVLVVGGNATIPGFVERLQNELRMLVNTDWKVRVKIQDDPIKSTWLGGARMASRHRDVVREYGITKEDYFEYGSAGAARKFAHGTK